MNKQLIIILMTLALTGLASATQDLGSCGYLNDNNTIYVMNQSISFSNIHCIYINASNITIDGAGFNLTGDN